MEGGRHEVANDVFKGSLKALEKKQRKLLLAMFILIHCIGQLKSVIPLTFRYIYIYIALKSSLASEVG